MSKSYKEKMQNKIYFLAEKYYSTRDLSKLTPLQLDKITTWATNHKPNQGQTQDRKAGRSKGRYIKGNL
jgi:hypothetical protein